MYFTRFIEDAIINTAEHFKVLYLSGSRQVGKTTVLARLAKQRNMTYVTLDDLRLRTLAQNDPLLFLQTYKSPVFIDEVQYAPQLFSFIKLLADKTDENGQYWLTGSQHLALMQGLKESLAGRVGILSLLGLSFAEETLQTKNIEPFFPFDFSESSRVQFPLLSPQQVFERIFRGSFPALAIDSTMPLERFYGSYVQTYLDRDVRELFGVEKMSLFQSFLGLVAARTGQILNISQLARDVGVSVHAAKSWISILEASGIVYLLQPYFTNISKRLIKSPKLYLLDTGLAAYLTRWPNAVTLQTSSMAGAMFETYVVSEIIKSFTFRGLVPPLYYVRTRDGQEIDLLMQRGQTFCPLEIKITTAPREDDVRSFTKLEKEIHKSFSHGAVVCMTNEVFPLIKNVSVIPTTMIQ